MARKNNIRVASCTDVVPDDANQSINFIVTKLIRQAMLAHKQSRHKYTHTHVTYTYTQTKQQTTKINEDQLVL